VTAVESFLTDALRDRYVIKRELGRGGMATVYLAHDLKHDRLVALKLLHRELAAALGPERFLREIRLTARLDHPHILPVFDSGEAAGLLWYTMPYVEGESLRERLRREVQLPVEEAVGLAREVADALDCAHQMGIVHRDIKPENILLSRGHARVADFGVARALEAAGTTQLTETGLTLGTPAYMSPEQATVSAKVGGRSDQYSLACVVYEMLAGEPPYVGPTAQAVIAKRFSEPIPHLSTVRAVPPGVEAAVTRALATAPADRFATVGEFAGALMAALGSASSPAGQVSRVRRRRIVLALLLCLGLAAAAFVWAERHQRAGPGRKMLAVLPLRNLGASPDQYFADGLTEEITSRLAGISGLGVISRTSADRYRNTSKPLKEIARELGVDYIIEGSVRWERQPDGRNHIRVTPELIQVVDDSHLWTNRYDADLSDVFRVQGDIAEQVTKALDVALADPERRKLAEQPTANLSAYDAYLRGNSLYPRDFTGGLDRIVTALSRAAEQYREAIRLDSTFALAYARLGRTMVDLYRSGPPEPAIGTAARQAIDRAFALAPTLSEARLARGTYHIFVERDWARARRELELALADRPNDADLLSTLALAEGVAGRRNMYSPASQAISHAERAALLDPQSMDKLLVLADMYRGLQRFDQAERVLRPGNRA
jgi:TolB-like protein